MGINLPLGEGATGNPSDLRLWFWESCHGDDWEAGNHTAFQSDQLGCLILGRELELDQLGCPVLGRELEPDLTGCPVLGRERVLVVENDWVVLFLSMAFQDQGVWSPWKVWCGKLWINLDSEGLWQVTICVGVTGVSSPTSFFHALPTPTTLLF